MTTLQVSIPLISNTKDALKTFQNETLDIKPILLVFQMTYIQLITSINKKHPIVKNIAKSLVDANKLSYLCPP
jgi:hypothetical protein